MVKQWIRLTANLAEHFVFDFFSELIRIWKPTQNENKFKRFSVSATNLNSMGNFFSTV